MHCSPDLEPPHDRGGSWLHAFLDKGNKRGGDTFTFTCQPGNCIVGYWGVVGHQYIGSIGFVQRREPAAFGHAVNGPASRGIHNRVRLSRSH